MDTVPLQRLRRIKQLALTSLVYPGATHTRFEHSLGVMDISGRIAERVGFPPNTRQWRLVRLAALLHDVGHVPLSHAGEAAMTALSPELANLGERAHERITASLIENDPDLCRILAKQQDRRAVLSILSKTTRRRASDAPEPILRQIVSGPLDADKLDYLLRDSLMAGVKYGVFDLDRMIDSFVAHGPSGDRHLAVRRTDLPCVEQAVLARYYITQQVYRHQVRRISDAMLKHAILSAASLRRAGARRVSALFRFRASDPEWLPRFLVADDAWLLMELAGMPESTECGKLARRLRDRRLLEQVFGCRIRELQDVGAAWREGLVGDVTKQQELAARFARRLDMDRDLVLLDIRQLGNPLYRDPGLPLEEDIMVVDERGRDERLGDIPESLSQKVRVEEEAELYVYAPADRASAAERARMERKIREELAKAAREARR